MSSIKIGCETYTWQMPGEQYKGKLEHIMKIVSKAGFSGIEPETSFFGNLQDPFEMKAVLDENGLELSALCHVEHWMNNTETDEERNRASKWMDFLSFFPDTIYLLVQMPGSDRRELASRQKNLLSCINFLAQRASDRGIKCSFHPNSPDGSVFRNNEDYQVLFDGLNTDYVQYCPDVGHIAKGGMDPLSILTQYRDIINLVHFKDMYKDGTWAQLGFGDIDLVTITKFLMGSQYKGWIIMEDECDRAIHKPDELTFEDGKYISTEIKPLLNQKS